MALLEAQTAYGWVKGCPTTYQQSTIFKGIPYAKPPVGNLRWKAPEKPEPWEGEYEAYTYGPIPMQARPTEASFYRKEFYPIEWPNSEDCLYINVITPAETPDEKLPVALWVYGGGFVQGYSQKLETDGEAFAQRDIVYVSFNYRVGPFGYLSCSALDSETDEGLSGNYGLLDQIAALDWVRENIAAFGGDPDNITIFGQSAGAMSVYSLLCSPLVKGKVARAIMESGGGPLPLEMADPRKTRETSEKFFEYLNCSTAKEAREIPSATLQEKWQEFIAENPIQGVAFCPVYPTTSLPCSIADAFREEKYLDIPCIIGTVATEDTAIGIAPIPEDVTNMRDAFMSGALAFCEKQAEQGRVPAYQYHITNVPPGPNYGAFHSSEHMYIFQTLLRSYRPYTGKDFELSRIMCAMWTNFIKTGNPNGEGLPEWSVFTKDSKRVMRFDREGCAMMDYPEYNGASRELANKVLD